MEDFSIIQKKAHTILSQLDPDTRDLAINILTYSQFPLEGHPDTCRIINTLIQCVPTHQSDNPVVIASQTAQAIYALAHGQTDVLLAILDDIHNFDIFVA